MMQVSILLVINMILLITIIFWPFAIFASFFMFDAPGSESNWIAIGLALSIWLYPIPLLIGDFWIKTYIQDTTKEELTPKIYIGFISPLSIIFFVWALNFFCNGKFTCN